MLKLFITVGGQTKDYTVFCDWTTVSIQEQINIPTQCTFNLIPSSATFVVPVQRAYVQIYSTKYDKYLFTGYVACEPVRAYLGVSRYSVTDPSYPPDQKLLGKPQIFTYQYTCTSDDYLLNIKAVPFIPAFINQSQGQILGGLANTLCPGFFDTSNMASGDIVPNFNYDPTKGWSEMAKTFADGIRYHYKVLNKQIYYLPYDDQPLGVVYDEMQPDRTFDPHTLQTTVLTVPLVNDVTIIGNAEAGNNHEDYFIGDGFTGNFPLRHQVYQGSSTLLLQETWNGNELNLQNWYNWDPGTNFDYSAQALNILTGSGSVFSTLGSSYLSMNNGIEVAGGLDLEHGEFTFNDYCSGVVGGLYTDNLFTSQSLLGGFQIASPNPLIYPTTTVQSSGSIIPALGVGGVEIQAIWNGATGFFSFEPGNNGQLPVTGSFGPFGETVTTKVNNSYVLQTLLSAPAYARYSTLYKSLGGEQWGGDITSVTGSVTFIVQEYDTIAATGFYYTPNIYKAVFNNVTLPAFCTYALINNLRLNLTATNTTVASMVLGTLQGLEGPSGLTAPTGLILPMLPAGSGGYTGPVQPWPSAASATNILLPPGRLNTQPNTLVMGNGFELETAQITAGNASDTLAFYSQTLPAAGVPIRFQSWEEQAAVSRLQNQESITSEAFVVGDDGIRSCIVTDLNPLPRTSEDCDNAALAYLADRAGVQYNGTYTCTSLFFQGLTEDGIFYPTCGRFLQVNSPRRAIFNQKFLITQLTTTVLEAATELLQFAFTFGTDTHLEKVLKNFVDIIQPSVLTPQDKANPPDPRLTINVDDSFLPDLNNVQVDMTQIGNTSIVVDVLEDYGGPIEVRLQDTNWGREGGYDYVGRVFGPKFTLRRTQIDQRWFLRPVQNGITSRRSKVLRVYYPVQPTPPQFVSSDAITAIGPSGNSVNTVAIQFDFTGDNRNIYGFEMRAADNQTVLVQKPVASFSDLYIDMSQNPFLWLSPALAGNYSLFVYFFNQQWSYSEPLVVDGQLLAGTRPPYPWQPGYQSPVAGDAMYVDDSFGVVPSAAPSGSVAIAIKGVIPVSHVSATVAPPILLSGASGTDGSLSAGLYLVSATAYDSPQNTASYGESPLSNILAINVGPSGSISLNLEWPAETSFGGQLYAGRSLDDLHFQGTLATNQSLETIDLINESSYGPPDPVFDHFEVLWTVDVHAGVLAEQIIGVSGNAVEFPNATFTTNQFAGGVLSLLAHDTTGRVTVNLQIANYRIVSNTANVVTVGPNAAGVQPLDLRTILQVGDVMTIRMHPTNISASGFTDPNFLNCYAPAGLTPSGEIGNMAWIISGPGSGQDPISIANNTNQSFTFASSWAVPPTSGSVIIIVSPAWQPAITTRSYTNKNYAFGATIVAKPDLTNVAGNTIVLLVRTEDSSGNYGDDAFAPFREMYIFQPPTATAIKVSYPRR